jgi:mannitol/fructose-specific phosphotransferase system IIA component (Ntr-type)
VISVPLLHHLLPATHIQLDVECEDWKEAIRAAAMPLHEMGYIEGRYITEVIRNVEENGPFHSFFQQYFCEFSSGLSM